MRRCFLRHRGGSVPPQLDGSCARRLDSMPASSVVCHANPGQSRPKVGSIMPRRLCDSAVNRTGDTKDVLPGLASRRPPQLYQ